jgi:hypothetical protein
VQTTVVADSAPQIVGLLPTGITADVAQVVGERIRAVFLEKGRGAIVRSLRFVPSSLIRLDAEHLQFVANATVVPKRASDDHRPTRAKVIDSVVTVDLSGAAGVVSDVTVPFLQTEPA